jgi:hypothetical protein
LAHSHAYHHTTNESTSHDDRTEPTPRPTRRSAVRDKMLDFVSASATPVTTGEIAFEIGCRPSLIRRILAADRDPAIGDLIDSQRIYRDDDPRYPNRFQARWHQRAADPASIPQLPRTALTLLLEDADGNLTSDAEINADATMVKSGINLLLQTAIWGTRSLRGLKDTGNQTKQATVNLATGAFDAHQQIERIEAAFNARFSELTQQLHKLERAIL